MARLYPVSHAKAGIRLVSFHVTSLAEGEGVTRAARSARLGVGLCGPCDVGPHSQTNLFRVAGPISLERGEVAGPEVAASSAVLLDPGALEPAAAGEAAQRALQGVSRFDTCVELLAPTAADGHVDPSRTKSLLVALLDHQVPVAFLRFPLRAASFEPRPRESWQLDRGVLERHVALCRETGTYAALHDDATVSTERLAPFFFELGFARIDLACFRDRGEGEDAARAEALAWARAKELFEVVAPGARSVG